jgi:EAL domain-containing protein (putative c-di-GMP-specific phosphodiesterase class I)
MSLLRLATVPGPLATVFQPIVDVHGTGLRLFAVECLTRGPRGSKLEGAVPLFEYVRRKGLENEMDHACITTALRNVAGHDECRISVNVHPATLAGSRDFVGHLLRESERRNIAPSRLIVEIGEQAPATDSDAFSSALTRLRECGVAIAVDDVGYGHSSFRSFIDCKPDYVKIDRYFVDHASEDPAKRAVIRSIMDLAGHFGSAVVAEGVERTEDHDTLREMGIHLFQGFLFGGPPMQPRAAWFQVTHDLNASN